MRRTRHVLALLAAAVLVGLPAAARAAQAAPAAAAPSPAASATAGTGPGRVTLLGQTTWVRPGGVFTLHLGIVAPHPAATEVQVAAFPAVTTRSGFEAAATGSEPYGAGWFDVQPVTSLPADPSGTGVDVRIPVNTDGAAPTGEKAFVPGSQAVYPFEVQLFSHGSAVGKAFTTFLVVAPTSGQVAQRLAVALVVPLPAPAPRFDHRLRLVAPSSQGLRAVTGALAGEPGVAVSLQPDPEALAALAGGSATDRQAVRSVGRLVRGGDELLPAPYVPVDYRALQRSGLGGEIVPEIDAGTTTLGRRAGQAPSLATWAVGQRIDGATLDSLQQTGLRRLVVPAADLSPLPAADTNVTYGRPTSLAGGLAPVSVWGADGPLSARLADRAAPALAAEQDLAEMVMTQMEAPSVSRGVAVLAPNGVDPRLLSTLVGGLAGNPYLVPVTVDGLFRRVPTPPGAPPRHLVVGGGTGRVGDQPGIVELSAELGSFRLLAPSETDLAGDARRALLLAAADDLGHGGGRAVIALARARIRGWERRISLPGAVSVTFTARAGKLPVTIQSTAHVPVHVRLQLTAPKLDFRAPKDVPGRCSTTAQSETCLLTVDRPLTTLRVPVISRTSGVFPLAVELSTPDGLVVLGAHRDSIRSTAVSWVGLVLMVGAGLSLLLWWVRDARHGRRAKRLVPRPEEGPDDRGGEGEPGPGGASPGPAGSEAAAVPRPRHAPIS